MQIKYTLQDQDTLRFRLDFYTNDIIATRFDQTALGFRVDVHDVMAVFANFHIYLPPNVCWVGQQGAQSFLGLFIPPAVYRLAVSYGEDNWGLFRIPLPPLWFYVTWEAMRFDHARLFALKSSAWPQPADRLYAAPMPNVDPASGSICLGNLELGPRAFPADAHAIFQFLMAAPFSNHQLTNKSRQYPDNVLFPWHELNTHQAQEYPLDDLVATAYTIRHFLNGEDSHRAPARMAAHPVDPGAAEGDFHEDEIPIPEEEAPHP